MWVFNLTNTDLAFHKRVIQANGGGVDFPELDSFITNRDRELSAAGVISFESLPLWWIAKRNAALEAQRQALELAVVNVPGISKLPMALKELPVEEPKAEPEFVPPQELKNAGQNNNKRR
jgi:hypothetical protein